MDVPVTFACHFGRLVSLILRKPDSIDEQKAELRALVTTSKSGPANLALRGDGLHANDMAVPTQSPGASDLIGQFQAHGLAAILFDMDALPADLLAVARIVAGMPVLGDGGSAVEAKRLAVGATTVRFAARSRHAEPMPDAVTRLSTSVAEIDFGDVYDDPIAEAKLRETPRHVHAVMPPGEKSGERRTGLFAQFAAVRAPSAPCDQLLASLDIAVDGDELADLLDGLIVLAEQAARGGKAAVVSEILLRIGRREGRIELAEHRRIFSLALKQLAKPSILRTVAMQLPREPQRRDELASIMVRAGDDGVDVLVEQLAAVSSTGDRRVYFEVLREMKAGVPALVHMLSDARWFVARTAAELLGEMQAPQAELPLTEMLKHHDDRARRAASMALMRLGTPRAMMAIDGGLKHDAAQTRIEAAAAIGARKDLRTAATLIRALDSEKDDEVRAAFLLSLGKLKTADAVQRLVQAADAERGLFKKKTTAFRVAAVHGLGEARTPAALEALGALQSDKEQEVRDAAGHTLGRIARAGGAPSTAAR